MSSATLSNNQPILLLLRILYQKSFNVTQALEFIEAEMPATSERDEIVYFINNSSRGIMKGYNRKFNL